MGSLTRSHWLPAPPAALRGFHSRLQPARRCRNAARLEQGVGHLATCHRQEHQGPTHVGTRAFERTLCYVPLPSPRGQEQEKGGTLVKSLGLALRHPGVDPVLPLT